MIKKRILTFICITLLIGCSTKGENSFVEDIADVEIKDNKFSNCFSKMDTSDYRPTVGCSGGYYKTLNDQYVIKLSSFVEFEYNDCQRVNVDDQFSNIRAELYVFEQGQASLVNLCADVIITNAPKAIQTITASSGKIIVGKSNPTDYYGNTMPRFSFYIEELNFIDTLKSDTIRIKDELLWKVLNRGTPG